MKKRVKKVLKDAYWSFRGAGFRNPALTGAPGSMLFICKGNICRSPFAEKLAEKMASGTELGGIQVSSAGLQVRKPLPSPTNAKNAAKRFGIDLDEHRSKPLTRELVEGFDLIVVMEAGQLKALRSSYPESYEKFFLLPFFENGRTGGYAKYNLADPYGKPIVFFMECFGRIEKSLQGLFSAAGKG